MTPGWPMRSPEDQGLLHLHLSRFFFAAQSLNFDKRGSLDVPPQLRGFLDGFSKVSGDDRLVQVLLVK